MVVSGYAPASGMLLPKALAAPWSSYYKGHLYFGDGKEGLARGVF